jgi:hypothetical protein
MSYRLPATESIPVRQDGAIAAVLTLGVHIQLPHRIESSV